ncbi:hypothetical protein BYT27DRAFT_7251250 [Phlegmacium glaucopus]|nr:hypothetical protein BYT27DRAFT_7264037 [Phlegmacium glaucopus]KAF8813170.1 hypothetical protein BYT27DRAFT_7251250 [Phlegmacium glaucopus]
MHPIVVTANGPAGQVVWIGARAGPVRDNSPVREDMPTAPSETGQHEFEQNIPEALQDIVMSDELTVAEHVLDEPLPAMEESLAVPPSSQVDRGAVHTLPIQDEVVPALSMAITVNEGEETGLAWIRGQGAGPVRVSPVREDQPTVSSQTSQHEIEDNILVALEDIVMSEELTVAEHVLAKPAPAVEESLAVPPGQVNMGTLPILPIQDEVLPAPIEAATANGGEEEIGSDTAIEIDAAEGTAGHPTSAPMATAVEEARQNIISHSAPSDFGHPQSSQAMFPS